MAIFRQDADYRAFLLMLREASARCETEVHGYTLMNNHVHILATPRAERGLARSMQIVGSRYARYFNKRHQRTGPLFESRYKSTVVDDERYWITCLRYIELNPVRAGIVSKPENYPWSSHRANAYGVSDPLVTRHARYAELGPSARDRQEAWQRMCASHLSTEELDWMRFVVYEQRVLGCANSAHHPPG